MGGDEVKNLDPLYQLLPCGPWLGYSWPRKVWLTLRWWPWGVLAIVLKGFTSAGLYVDLPGQTEAMLLAAGWAPHDHWRRELWSLSFWRILQKRRDPAAFDDRLNYEEVLAFRKPGGGCDEA